MPEIQEIELKELSAAVLEHTARDAKKGDPTAAAYFLSADGLLFGQGCDLEPAQLGKMAFRLFEVLVYGE